MVKNQYQYILISEEQWKIARSHVTQSFTSIRFKHMSDVLQILADEHINDLKIRGKGETMKLNIRE